MDRRATALAALALAASLAACGEKRDDPAAKGTATPSPVSAAPAPAASVMAGPPVAFFQCRSCHAVDPGRHGIGPSLHGIMGAKAGAAPGFAFSKALRESGLTWDRATMEQWLVSPTRMVPGTRMVNRVPDPVRRKEIIDYLETLQ